MEQGTCELVIDGMMCISCEWAIESALKKDVGFISAKISHRKGRAIVTYDPSKTEPNRLAAVVTEKSGYPTKVK